MTGFSHLDDDGNVRMVDVSSKPGTVRTARASGYIAMHSGTLALLREEGLPKGNVLTTAKIAGIQAAKRAAHLIPLCHQLDLSWVDIEFGFETGRILISAVVKTRESTGVEMEALTAVTVAALTVYDMCKAVDGSMEIGGVRLDAKSGGKTPGESADRPKAGVLVVSDSVASGSSDDRSGALLRDGLAGAGCEVGPVKVVPDEPADIVSAVSGLMAEGAGLILTTGGTGLGPRDVTVETLSPKFTRRLPGVEQALFQWGQGKVGTAMLSRLAAGTIDDTLVVCLPGSTGAARDALEVLLPSLFHAFDMIRGEGHG